MLEETASLPSDHDFGYINDSYTSMTEKESCENSLTSSDQINPLRTEHFKTIQSRQPSDDKVRRTKYLN